MRVPQTLSDAITVFCDLGWNRATLAQVLELPLGTHAQQRIARAGLSKGEWGSIGQIDDRTYGWTSWIDVNEDMLGAFAVRVGVPVKRAVAVMPRPHACSVEVRAALIAARGAAFVSAFAETNRGARWHGDALISAIVATDAPVPENLDYLSGWAETAAVSLDTAGELLSEVQIPVETIASRYLDHLRAALRSHNPAPNGAATLVAGGIERQLVSRDEACDLVLFAMEQAQRPIDRKTWAAVLTDTLDASPEWLLARASVLVSVMSFGDDQLITRFAPVLLHSGDDELVMQAMLIGLTAKSAKAKAALLEVAADVAAPGEAVREVVAASVAELLGAKDTKVRNRAAALIAAWNLTIAEADPAPQAEAPELRGLWQATPPIAGAPRFDPGPVTADQLATLAAELTRERTEGVTLVYERFIATANALAHSDTSSTRTALRGLTRSTNAEAAAWVKDEPCFLLDPTDPDAYMRHRSIETARGASVFQRLGAVPVLLSTPSWDDWRIDPADLVDRLEAYAAAGEPVVEADLQAALPRLDLELVTDDLALRLAASTSPIVLQDGSLVSTAASDGTLLTAGAVLAAWLREPLVHPGFQDAESPYPREIAPVPALADLPPRLTNTYLWAPIPYFPNWPDARIPHRNPWLATLRNHANGPVPAAQLLDLVGEEASDPSATIAAWRNGVLVPGVADTRRLGWRGQIPSLAARAAGWSELIEAGLLSVVWPIAVETIELSSQGPRVAPGVAELVEMLERYLREVQAAVDAGIADPEALRLAAVRTLAQRGGSSRAVAAAKSLVALLPAGAGGSGIAGAQRVAGTGSELPGGEDPEQTLDDAAFAVAWPDHADPAEVRDGATFEVVARSGTRGSCLEPQITLADGSVHRVKTMHWAYSLIHEQQTLVSGSVANGKWLRYSASAGALVAGEGRRDGARGEADEVLSHTLAVVLCLTQYVQPDEPEYDFYSAIERGLLGPTRVRAVIADLLGREGFDPYRLVRRLPRHPEALPVLYPVLVAAIAYAAKLEGKPPAWLVRVIDVATVFAPALRAAAERGRISAAEAAWPGLAEIARGSRSAAAKRKAGLLCAALGLAVPAV